MIFRREKAVACVVNEMASTARKVQKMGVSSGVIEDGTKPYVHGPVRIWKGLLISFRSVNPLSGAANPRQICHDLPYENGG